MSALPIVALSLLIGGPVVIVFFVSLLSTVKAISVRRLDHSFKLKLLDRGLSINEIERLLAGKSNASDVSQAGLENAPQPPRK